MKFFKVEREKHKLKLPDSVLSIIDAIKEDNLEDVNITELNFNLDAYKESIIIRRPSFVIQNNAFKEIPPILEITRRATESHKIVGYGSTIRRKTAIWKGKLLVGEAGGVGK